MKCFYNYEIEAYNKTAGQLVNGIYIAGTEVFDGYISADIQPYSRELLLKEYGYDIDVSNRIFTDLNDIIRVGTVLEYNDSRFEVRKVINWENYMEVMCYGI